MFWVSQKIILVTKKNKIMKKTDYKMCGTEVIDIEEMSIAVMN